MSIENTIPFVLTVAQVAELLQISPNTVRRAIRDGRLVASRLGGNDLRIQRQAVDAWIASTSTSSKKKENTNMPAASILTLPARILDDGSLEVGGKNVAFAPSHPAHRLVVDEFRLVCVEVDADEIDEDYYSVADPITCGGTCALEKAVHHGGEMFDLAKVVWDENPRRAEVVNLRRRLRIAAPQEWRDHGPEVALFVEET